MQMILRQLLFFFTQIKTAVSNVYWNGTVLMLSLIHIYWYSYLRNDVLENFIFIIIHNSQGLINWCNFEFIVEKCRKMNGLFA